jgi:hypothetical protein
VRVLCCVCCKVRKRNAEDAAGIAIVAWGREMKLPGLGTNFLVLWPKAKGRLSRRRAGLYSIY